MSTEENKALIHQFVEELNNKESGLVEHYYAAQDPALVSDRAHPFTLEELQNMPAVELGQVFPNGRYYTENLLANGDKVLWYWTFQVSDESQSPDQLVMFRGANLFRTENGKIVEDLRIGAIDIA